MGAAMRSGAVVWLCLLGLGVAGGAARAPAAPALPGVQGAIAVPFEMPFDGQATIALYTPSGRVVRVLAQVLELPKGRYTIPWDGMDLWGHLVPAGADLTVKVITHPGLRAVYEFTVGHAGSPPWLTAPMGEGPAMRTGGWMGDHTPPISALAFGDRLFFGCEVAEHGHALIATDLDGEKLWGRGGLSGWRGPAFLATDGKTIFGVAERETFVYRIDPQSCQAKRIHDASPDRIQALAAHDGKVWLVLRNHEAGRSPFTPSVDGRSFDFDRSRPLIPKGWKPVERQISPRERFATVFYRGGHPQTGLRAEPAEGMAYVLVKLAKPVPVGTLVLDRIDGVAKADVYTLKPGIAYDTAKHEPGLRLDITTIELEPEWVLFGKTDFPRPLALLPAPRASFSTDVLLLRLLPPKGQVGEFRPTLGMCRILARRVAQAEAGLGVLLPQAGLATASGPRAAHPDPPAGDPKETQPAKGEGGKEPASDRTARGWHFRAEKPISEVYPQPVILDLGKDVAADGLCLLGCTNPVFAVDRFKGPKDRDLAEAPETDWEEVTAFQASHSRRTGWATARAKHNETTVPFFRQVAARALRLRFTKGYGGGKWGEAGGKDDPFRCAVGHVALLKLLDEGGRVPSHILQARHGGTGELVRESRHPSVDLAAMAFDADGTLYTLADGKLCRSTLEGDGVAHTVLNDREFKEPVTLALSADRIAVGDLGRHAVLVFDKQGKLQTVVGDKGPRVRGPWNPDVVERPTGVAIDRNGKIWIAERLYAPKRISRFSADGKFEKELFGPAEYGGGGFLDPDLGSFYYRSMHFALDWEKGTSVLKNLNDRLYTEETPTLDPHSFAYTKVGRPIYHKGRRYIVGDPGYQGSPGIVVCLLEDGLPVWRPCAVLAKAEGSPFLLKKECWKRHWAAQDLIDRYFIWCDRNGDGAYQVEEVELFQDERFPKGPFQTAYWCNWLGPDLAFWGQAARLAPTRITDRGVPIYESRRLEPFSYHSIAPTYTASLRCGMRAKPGPEGTSIVLADGSLIVEGQPYRILPDLTVYGGKPDAKPSGYQPPIHGVILDNPLHFVGSAITESPVGEVAMVLGNSGRWFVESVRDRVVIGQIFTGKEGGWGTDLPAKRGIEVTHRRLGSECFFGHFTKAHNGKYYTVAGHGFHALSRIEGLDAYQVQTAPLKVTAEAQALNAKLRQVIVSARAAAADAAKRKQSRTFLKLEKRTANFKLDGEIADWGGTAKMAEIDRKAELFLDGAWDEAGLYLAYAGVSPIGNHSEDVHFLFKTGFCLDLRLRTDPRSRSGSVVAGDRRIVFGRHQGKGLAVLYDYIDEAVPREKWVEFASPWVTTRVARVVVLPEDAVKVRFHVVDDLLRDVPKGKSAWTAEVLAKWSALGIASPHKLRLLCDFGIHVPDSGGVRVEQRAYWSHRGELTVSDLGVEAMLNPGAWGTVTFE